MHTTSYRISVYSRSERMYHQSALTRRGSPLVRLRELPGPFPSESMPLQNFGLMPVLRTTDGTVPSIDLRGPRVRVA